MMACDLMGKKSGGKNPGKGGIAITEKTISVIPKGNAKQKREALKRALKKGGM